MSQDPMNTPVPETTAAAAPAVDAASAVAAPTAATTNAAGSEAQALAMPQRFRVLDPERFHYSYLRATAAELRKARLSKGFWITGAVVLAIAFFMGWLFTWQEGPMRFDPSVTTLMLWDFFALFLIPHATLIVTNEYSHNTMRTTVMAVPNRFVAFAAKMTAVLIFCGTLALAILAVQLGAVYLFGEITGTAAHTFRSLAMCWLVLTTLSLGTAGLAYIFRSTAGTIITVIVVLEFASLLTLIPNDTVREFLQKFLPEQVGRAAMNTGGSGNMLLELSGMGKTLDWPIAALVWLIYMAALVIGGLVRFRRSDI